MQRGHCSFCKKKKGIQVPKSEQHMWLECENKGQSLAWETAKRTWYGTSTRNWPDISLGSTRGAAALAFEMYDRKGAEGLCILITMTTRAIWKSRSKNSINDQDVASCEASEVL